MGRKITPSVSEYAQEFQRPAALRDVRKEYDDDELKRSTHQASMSIVTRQQDYLSPRQGTRKGSQIHINLTQSSSPSVGAGVGMIRGGGLYGRPSDPVYQHDRWWCWGWPWRWTTRATIKAPHPSHPPSPLRKPGLASLVDAYRVPASLLMFALCILLRTYSTIDSNSP